MAGATPACDPDNKQEANTSESNSNQDSTSGPIEAIDVQIIDLPDKINRVFDKLETAS
jgi:hypothetical protein